MNNATNVTNTANTIQYSAVGVQTRESTVAGAPPERIIIPRPFVQAEDKPELPAKSTQFQSRPAPKLANAVSLCSETASLVLGKSLTPQGANLLETSYGSRPGHTPAQNLAANLLLDLNMHFEERLQHQIEHHPAAVPAIKQVVKAVHQMMQCESMPTDLGDMTALDLLDHRLKYLENALKGHFPEARLKSFLDARRGSDAAVDAFKKEATTPLGPKQLMQVKLLKMLFSQLPYFGGSLEYKLRRSDTLEFWIYHLSTITRDAGRTFGPESGQGKALIKPMMDYITPKGSLVPRNNQRNLGTGIAEASWEQLPKGLQDDIKGQLAYQLNKTESAVKSEANVMKLGAERIAENIARFDAIRNEHGLGAEATVVEMWPKMSEDERKIVYGDIAQIPWSDAHLQDLTGAFEVDYDIKDGLAAVPQLSSHPDMHGLTGVMNVDGVDGNILHTPAHAADAFIKELEAKFGAEAPDKVKPDHTLKPTHYDKIRNDFVTKQTAWYQSTYSNHKPIIGGMSGHALGYLNLYSAALEKLGDKGTEDHPKLETLRALMLAALVGHKRHHSYDEVMAASVAIESGGEKLGYTDRASYADVLQSEDPMIKNAATKALKDAASKYIAVDHGSVLATLRTLRDDHGLVDAKSKELSYSVEKHVVDYFAAMESGDLEAIRKVRHDLEATIVQHLPETGTEPGRTRPRSEQSSGPDDAEEAHAVQPPTSRARLEPRPAA